MSGSDDPLSRLVAHLERSGLREPTAILLEMISPVDLISSQIARFGQPFARGTGAEPLIERLGDAAAWAELRRLLAAQD